MCKNGFRQIYFSKKNLFRVIFIAGFLSFIFAQPTKKEYEYYYLKHQFTPKKLAIIEKAYPDLIFKKDFNTELHQWEIKLTMPDGRQETFYWCNGSMLPKEELNNADKYWTLLYQYNRDLMDPAEMTKEQRDFLKEYSSDENRKEGTGTPMFFYDFVYNAYSRSIIEKEIIITTFFGKRTKIHKRIELPLKQVEDRINLLAVKDEAVRDFIENIKSADAYYWRQIAGTNRKSFHSLGIAIDILPEKYKGEMFWSWTKDKDPEGWMLTPLSQRWMPPKRVIDIFEEEGFIWGGKWGIWDNMHFEYHPELLVK